MLRRAPLPCSRIRACARSSAPLARHHQCALTTRAAVSSPLQVASDGEIVWLFPSGFEAAIASKSWRLRAEPALKGEPFIHVAAAAAAAQCCCCCLLKVMPSAHYPLPQKWVARPPAWLPLAPPARHHLSPTPRRPCPAPAAHAAAKAGLEYLVRVAFGTALIASVCAVYVAIAAIASGGSDRDDRRRGGGGGFYGGPRVYFDLTDLLWYW